MLKSDLQPIIRTLRASDSVLRARLVKMGAKVQTKDVMTNASDQIGKNFSEFSNLLSTL